MKAIELQSFGLDGLTPVQREPRQPAADEVLVQMKSASLNFHDLVTILGLANPKLQMPVVPLSDGCGEVVDVGAAVMDLKPGDRVASLFFQGWQDGEPNLSKMSRVTGETADGVLQEQWCTKADAVAKVPDHLTDLEVATLPCAALTAWRSVVVEGQVKAGDRVLLQGTGGVSLFALQFAKLLGAETIITSSSDHKLERARQLGADHCINYKETPKWGKAARELSGGEGVDLVVEVGGSGTFQESLKAVRIGGHVSVIGVLSGVADVIPIARIMAMNLNVKGITVGNRKQFDDMCAAIALHRLQPVVGEVFGFDQAAEGLELMQQGGHFGKICLDFNQ